MYFLCDILLDFVDLSICVLSICISVTRFSIRRLKGLIGFVFVLWVVEDIVSRV